MEQLYIELKDNGAPSILEYQFYPALFAFMRLVCECCGFTDHTADCSYCQGAAFMPPSLVQMIRHYNKVHGNKPKEPPKEIQRKSVTLSFNKGRKPSFSKKHFKPKPNKSESEDIHQIEEIKEAFEIPAPVSDDASNIEYDSSINPQAETITWNPTDHVDFSYSDEDFTYFTIDDQQSELIHPSTQFCQASSPPCSCTNSTYDIETSYF